MADSCRAPESGHRPDRRQGAQCRPGRHPARLRPGERQETGRHRGGAGAGRIPRRPRHRRGSLDCRRAAAAGGGRRSRRGRRRAACPGRQPPLGRACPARAGTDGPQGAAGRAHRAALSGGQAPARVAHGLCPRPDRRAALYRSHAAAADCHGREARLPRGLAGSGHAAAAGQQGRRRRSLAQALYRTGPGPALRRGTQPRLGPGLPVAVADRGKAQGLRPGRRLAGQDRESAGSGGRATPPGVDPGAAGQDGRGAQAAARRCPTARPPTPAPSCWRKRSCCASTSSSRRPTI